MEDQSNSIAPVYMDPYCLLRMKCKFFSLAYKALQPPPAPLFFPPPPMFVSGTKPLSPSPFLLTAAPAPIMQLLISVPAFVHVLVSGWTVSLLNPLGWANL